MNKWNWQIGFSDFDFLEPFFFLYTIVEPGLRLLLDSEEPGDQASAFYRAR